MIKFEEHEGKLFLMLEEPVPLTADAEMPCLIRLIQDDSPMGRYNKAYSVYKYGVRLRCCMLPIIATHIAKNGVVNDIEWDVSRYEIIGYPVVEGSKEWALYQIRSGKKVVKEGEVELYSGSFYKNRLFYLNGSGCLVTQNAIGLIDPCSEEEFLDQDKTGWQIYKEPESQYKVGDWVETTNHRHVKLTKFPADYYKAESNVYECVNLSLNKMHLIEKREILRKLSHSEVVIHIGCLSGTVRPVSTNGTHIWFHLIDVNDRIIATIRISCLDIPTRKLVESLLKAQEEVQE